MATVITNLLSAIPVFGHDLVESNNLIILYNSYWKAKVHMTSIIPVLTTIGTVSPHAFKKGQKIRLNKEEYLSVPYPFIAFLVGLIDGDGYIQIAKTTKNYIAMRLVICLSLEDVSSLEYIYSILKIGKIYKDRDRLNPTCKLVFNKTDLQEILFPLLIHHNIYFLTKSRRSQFDLAMYILKNNIKFYKEIAQYTTRVAQNLPTFFNLPVTSEDYLKLYFFKNWLVGFTNAEGSFFRRVREKINNDGCFQLKQIIHIHLFEAFKLLFETKRVISLENNKYAQFGVSSKKDIQNVINFFSFSGLHPLVGLKNIQYLKWLNELQNSSRYKNLNFLAYAPK